MIEITTLLLGLITGPQVVGFTAAPQVVSVVLEVDGRVAAGGRLEEGAGAARIDLGEEPGRSPPARPRGDVLERRADRTGARLGRWRGLVDDVSDLARFEGAVARLRGELDRQRLVWLSGVDLPQDVRFGDCACCQPAV